MPSFNDNVHLTQRTLQVQKRVVGVGLGYLAAI